MATENLAATVLELDRRKTGKRLFHLFLVDQRLLPPRPVLLRISPERSQREVAAFLNLPVSTVNNRLRAARNHLKQGGYFPMAKDALTPHRLPDDFAEKIGEIIRAQGAVIDARFPPDRLPAVLNALTITDDTTDFTLTAQVAQRLGDDAIRCIAVTAPDQTTSTFALACAWSIQQGRSRVRSISRRWDARFRRFAARWRSPFSWRPASKSSICSARCPTMGWLGSPRHALGQDGGGRGSDPSTRRNQASLINAALLNGERGGSRSASRSPNLGDPFRDIYLPVADADPDFLQEAVSATSSLTRDASAESVAEHGTSGDRCGRSGVIALPDPAVVGDAQVEVAREVPGKL